jgi:hypothetical protein
VDLADRLYLKPWQDKVALRLRRCGKVNPTVPCLPLQAAETRKTKPLSVSRSRLSLEALAGLMWLWMVTRPPDGSLR